MDINSEKTGTTKAGNKKVFQVKRLIVDLENERAFLEIEGQHRDSDGDVIQSIGHKTFDLPQAVFDSFTTQAKLDTLASKLDENVNPIEPV